MAPSPTDDGSANPARLRDGRQFTRRHVLGGIKVAGISLGGFGLLMGSGRRRETGVVEAESAARGITGELPANKGKAVRTGGTVIGANLNGRPRMLTDNLNLLDASHTTWIRAFIDVREKLASSTAISNDPDIVALRRAAEGKQCHLIVSLKWDFKANWGDKDPISLPESGSRDEQRLLECATDCLEQIRAPLDIVVLGNEPMWETHQQDTKGNLPPIVRFTRTVKNHLVEHGNHGTPQYLVGAFNRIHSPFIRNHRYKQFCQRMLELTEDDAIAGIDLHVHYDNIKEAAAALKFAREHQPDKVITVTEFSPVWRYDRFKDRPIGESHTGKQFAKAYGISSKRSAVEYFEHAKANPRPAQEIADFYTAMPWYNVRHVHDMAQLFDAYGVKVGTLGFLQGKGMRNIDWTAGWTPFHINFLFQPALIDSAPSNEATAHMHYLADYRERARPEGSAQDRLGTWSPDDHEA